MKPKIFILISTLVTTITMFIFEFVKESVVHENLSRWDSHIMTIIFTTLLSLLISTILIYRYRDFRRKQELMRLKEEKLKTLKQAMFNATHYVNNLSNNLQLVQVELGNNKIVSKETVEMLTEAIHHTTLELKKLSNIDDPFDESEFNIFFL
ncbi:MAG: hypothetical protein IEMM0008_0366 [bacterium]|nr:MAG: hypothetical protein IEMM0008_0366 [bacterium]